MTHDEARMVEDLKGQLKAVEQDIERLNSELAVAQGQKQKIYKQIQALTDEVYEQEMLSLLYENKKASRK